MHKKSKFWREGSMKELGQLINLVLNTDLSDKMIERLHQLPPGYIAKFRATLESVKNDD